MNQYDAFLRRSYPEQVQRVIPAGLMSKSGISQPEVDHDLMAPLAKFYRGIVAAIPTEYKPRSTGYPHPDQVGLSRHSIFHWR